MSLEARLYLNWDEASVLLGVDREGLRQLMVHKLSPYHGDRQSPWLPVVINSKDREFFTHLRWDMQNKIPDLTWRVLHFDIQERVIQFSDGTELPLKGYEDGASYEAVSDHLGGYHNCFLVGGERLAVSPETVRRACENDGYVDDLGIAPYAWCKIGFSDDLYFRVLESKNSLHINKPESIYESTFFLIEDVLRIKLIVDQLFRLAREAAANKIAIKTPDEKPLDERERATLHLIIGALAIKANLGIDEPFTAAKEIEAVFIRERIESPDVRTIGRHLKKVTERLVNHKK